MINEILARIFTNELAVSLVVIAVMLAFAEIGYRLGLRLHATNDLARKGQMVRRLIALALAGVTLFFASSSATMAQTDQPESQQVEPEAAVDDNPTRAVFFSVREEYRNLANGAWNNRLIFRKDKVVLKGERLGGRTGFLLRTDVPLTTT